jgi:hypothetical protein
MGPQIARRWGLSDGQLLARPSYDTSPLFTDLEITIRSTDQLIN